MSQAEVQKLVSLTNQEPQMTNFFRPLSRSRETVTNTTQTINDAVTACCCRSPQLLVVRQRTRTYKEMRFYLKKIPILAKFSCSCL